MRMLACLTRRLLRLVGALAAFAALVALLAGVPWGLVTFLGWPLPDHLPTSGEIESVLLNPLSVTLLLDMLACIAWPFWLVFAVDVARCIPDAVRGVRPPAIGPVHAVAGLLVATAVLGLLPRSPVAAEPATATPVQPTAAVTVLEPATEAVSAVDSPIPTHPVQHTNSALVQGIVRVQSPHDGVYDSLWRIAERELGDGHRWSELFALNQGRPQPDGATLTDPHLIRPGWILHLPEQAEDSTPIPRPAPPAQPPAISTPTLPAPPPEEAVPGRPGTSEGAVAPASSTAVMLGSGGLVAATLAAAVSLGMLTRRRRRMRSYKPGSGDRTPMPAPAPAVHALRLAHDHAHLGEEPTDLDSITLPARTPDIDLPSVETDSTYSVTDVDVGVRDGRAYLLDLAAVHGLGLTGAGAEASARSLLVHLLATTSATLLIPDHDAQALLGDDAPESPRLHTTTDLDEAITALADSSTTRHTDLPSTKLTRVLVASIDQPHPRLQAILDTESASGAAAILLGHWPAGATVRVRADGEVTATSPEVAELRGAQLFHLGATDTRDLLDLLTDTTRGPRPDHPDNTDEAELTSDDHIDETEPDRDAEPAVTEIHEAQPEFAADETIPVLQHQESAPSSTTPSDPRYDAPDDAGRPDGNQLADTEPAHEPPKRPLSLAVFGPLTLTWRPPEIPARNLTAELAPKHKALITYLALHPHGTTRASVREALWPEARGRRPYNAFYAALSQIRKALAEATDNHAADLVVQHDEHVALNSQLVGVDYWQLNQAEHDRHIASTDEQRFAAWSRIVTVYTGEITDGMSALWLDGPREAAHRTVLDALAGMAAHYRSHDPHKQLQLLEHARLLNPGNEDIYRDIMRVQAELGLTDAISRTLHLLTTTLAEIGERPDPNTLALARTLQVRQHHAAS